MLYNDPGSSTHTRFRSKVPQRSPLLNETAPPTGSGVPLRMGGRIGTAMSPYGSYSVFVNKVRPKGQSLRKQAGLDVDGMPEDVNDQ